jgi:hypothetical protein
MRQRSVSFLFSCRNAVYSISALLSSCFVVCVCGLSCVYHRCSLNLNRIRSTVGLPEGTALMVFFQSPSAASICDGFKWKPFCLTVLVFWRFYNVNYRLDWDIRVSKSCFPFQSCSCVASSNALASVPDIRVVTRRLMADTEVSESRDEGMWLNCSYRQNSRLAWQTGCFAKTAIQKASFAS